MKTGTAVPFRPNWQPVTYFSHVSQATPEGNNGRPPVADHKDYRNLKLLTQYPKLCPYLFLEHMYINTLIGI